MPNECRQIRQVVLTIPPKMKTLSLQQAAEWPTRGGGADPPLMMGVTHFMLSVCRMVTSSSSSPLLCPLHSSNTTLSHMNIVIASITSYPWANIAEHAGYAERRYTP